jgi:hypothetical protein
MTADHDARMIIVLVVCEAEMGIAIVFFEFNFM